MKKNIRLSKKNKKRIQLVVPMFNIIIYVFVLSKNTTIENEFKKIGYPDMKYEDKNPAPAQARCVFFGNGIIALVFYENEENNISYDSISHEVLHAVDFIIEYIGETSELKEVKSYFMGYILANVIDILENFYKVKLINNLWWKELE